MSRDFTLSRGARHPADESLTSAAPGELFEIVEGALGEIRRLLLRVAVHGPTHGGFDLAAAATVARVFAGIVDARGDGRGPGDPVHDDLVAGGLIGALVGSGGMQVYADYVGRHDGSNVARAASEELEAATDLRSERPGTDVRRSRTRR